MLDNYSELGRLAVGEISATRGGPLIRRDITSRPPTGERGIDLEPPNALEDQVLFFNFCLLSTAVAAILLFVFCDMGRTEEYFEGKYDAK